MARTEHRQIVFIIADKYNVKAKTRQSIEILSFVVMFFAFTGKLYAQSTSTQGTDFWLSFGRNGLHNINDLNLQVRIVTGSNLATIKFTYTELDAANTVIIPARSVRTFSFSETEKINVCTFETEKSNKSLHIESDEPISVYALNQHEHSTDATNVLPVSGLGTEYYHISYKSGNPVADGYTLVATENNTEIYNNSTLITTLNKGQVYSEYFEDTDLTGMHITSTHPVAYFTTNQGVFVPIATGTGDCLYQQLVPVKKWGWNFLVPVTHRGVERIRIVASQDGTVITQTGGTVKKDNGGFSQNSLQLDKGQFVELETTLNSCGCYIKSNKPVGVCSYLMGTLNMILLDKIGDPAMSWIPPIEQSVNEAIIAPFVPNGQSAISRHYALIVTPTSTKNQTKIAMGAGIAADLTGGNWCDNSESGYSFYSLRLTNTNESYCVSNPYGLTVLCYGIGTAESYYYLTGATSRDLDAALYINNIYYKNLDNNILCDTVINFRALLRYAQTSAHGFLRWYIDEVEQTTKTDILEWTKIIPAGEHTVSIKVLNMDNDMIELFTRFTTSTSYQDTISETICLGERYYKNGFDVTPTKTGTIYQPKSSKTVKGCDSIVILQLTTIIPHSDTINATICLNEIYNDNGFDIEPTNAGFFTYEYIYKTSENCYNITVLNLTVNPIFDEYISAQIYEDEFYQIGDYKYNTPGIHITNLQTAENCDSIVYLNLSVIYYPPEITAFSPFNKDGINDYFMAGFKVQIFNRYGTLIYETNTVEQQTLGWDGRNSKGQEVEPGMYFYILYNSTGQPRIKSSVEVLRK